MSLELATKLGVRVAKMINRTPCKCYAPCLAYPVENADEAHSIRSWLVDQLTADGTVTDWRKTPAGSCGYIDTENGYYGLILAVHNDHLVVSAAICERIDDAPSI